MRRCRHRLDLEKLESREMLSAGGTTRDHLPRRFRGVASLAAPEVPPGQVTVDTADMSPLPAGTLSAPAPPPPVPADDLPVPAVPPPESLEGAVTPDTAHPQLRSDRFPTTTDDSGSRSNEHAYNHRPTTQGFSDVAVLSGTPSTVIDLFAAFDDVEDADELLTYEVVRVSHPELFDSMRIDPQRGTLTLDYAEDASGSSTVVLRATDTGGLSVEMTSAGAEFDVHGDFGFQASVHRPDLNEIGLRSVTRLTSFAFFERAKDGTYDFSRFSESTLRRILENNIPEPFADPIVLNIELDSYDNSPEGRDNLARVLDVASDVRPDLKLGYYRLLPERNWLAPVSYQRALDELASGETDGWFARNLKQHRAAYDGWLARNERYRTEEVSRGLGGGTVAQRVDVIYPSLYTFYEPAQDLWADPNVQYWDVYARQNIAEARKFGLPVVAYISPSVTGTGQSFLPKEFFRHQLDMLYELSDGVIIYASAGQDPFAPDHRGWLEAVDEFMQYIHTPTEFEVSVQPADSPKGILPPVPPTVTGVTEQPGVLPSADVSEPGLAPQLADESHTEEIAPDDESALREVQSQTPPLPGVASRRLITSRFRGWL